MTKELVFPAVLISLFIFSSQADIVIYTSGTSNAGLTGDATQTFTLRGASVSGSSPDTAWGGINDVQVSGTFFADPDPGYALLSLDNLFSGEQGQFITSGADITSANLFMYQNLGSSGSGTLTVRGLSLAASDWNEASATWNNKDASATGWDGAGGDINTQLTGSYGTAAFSDANENSWISIDITAALKAYADGTIAGLVLTTDADGGFTTLPVFSIDSNENPSGNSIVLQVDQIPEPTAVSLILIGGSFIYGMRRHRKNKQESIAW